MKAVAPLLLVAAALATQEAPVEPPASPVTPQAQEVAASSDSLDSNYRIGPGDILEVAILRPEEITRTPVVQPSGMIVLPPLRDEVEVSGLTIDEARERVAEYLGRFLVDPLVELRVKEFRSQWVLVTGEVNTPGRKSLSGRTRLFDVLLAAGGFGSRASGHILITRQQGSFEDGKATLRLKLTQGSPTPQDLVNLELPLRHGDVIAALQKFFVTVEGEVSRPGRMAVDDDLTVSGAVAAAGGLTRFGRSTVRVRRSEAAGGASVFEVDLEAVRDGKIDDPAVAPNDVITVRRRMF